MEYVVIGNQGKINFGATGVEEVLQNVRMILTTPIFTVPLDREFGVDYSMLDMPMETAQALLRAEIYAKIRRYEPRATITDVSFEQSTLDHLDGRMIPRVRLEVNLNAA